MCVSVLYNITDGVPVCEVYSTLDGSVLCQIQESQLLHILQRKHQTTHGHSTHWIPR